MTLEVTEASGAARHELQVLQVLELQVLELLMKLQVLELQVLEQVLEQVMKCCQTQYQPGNLDRAILAPRHQPQVGK